MPTKKYLPKEMRKELKENPPLGSSPSPVTPSPSLPNPPSIAKSPPTLTSDGNELKIPERTPHVQREPQSDGVSHLLTGEAGAVNKLPPEQPVCSPAASGHGTRGSAPCIPGRDEQALHGPLSAADFIDAELARLTRQMKHVGYSTLESSRSMASRYRKIDLQRAYVRGEVAYPKKVKKKH